MVLKKYFTRMLENVEVVVGGYTNAKRAGICSLGGHLM